MRQHPTTPTREDALCDLAYANGFHAGQQEGSESLNEAIAVRRSAALKALKQRLTSEPAASVPVTREQREACARVIYDAFPYDAGDDENEKPEWVVGGNSLMQDRARTTLDAILALLAASTGARGVVVEEIAKRHKAIIGKQLDIGARDKATAEAVRDAFADRATLLALIGAKQP